MRRSGTGSGGGIGMNKNVEKSVRTGAGAKAAHEGGVSQLGQKQGSHITRGGDTGYRGDPLFAGPGYNPVKYGNELATNVGKGGPGAGRDPAMRSGSQGCHGPTNPGMAGLPSTKGQWPDKR